MDNSRGQTLIEFAFVAPLIIILLFTIVDFGIAMDRRITLQHAVREGARYAAVHTDTAAIQQTTADQAQDIIGPADVDVCYLDGDDANATVGDAGDSVRVSAAFTYDLPIFGSAFSDLFGGSVGSIDMTPSGTARLELSVTGASPCP